MGCGRPCHGSVAGLAGRVVGLTARAVSLRPRACREPPCAVSWRAAGLYRSAVPLYRNPKSPPQSRYKSLYRDPAPSHMHYTPCRACSRSYRRPPSHIMAKKWPYRGLLRFVVARPCALPPNLACHNTVFRIVT